jgi:hypothetical protein
MKNYFLPVILALSIPAFADTTLTIKTGAEGGGYHRLGVKIQEMMTREAVKNRENININQEFSNGTIENIQSFDSEQSDIVIVQADGLNVNPPTRSFRASKGPMETVFWLYNKDHAKTDLADIEGSKEYLVVVVDDSGAKVTLDSFVKEDKGYKTNADNVILAEDLFEAAAIVSEGRYENSKVAGLLYVGTRLPSDITEDFSKNIRVGTLDGDKDFNDAKDVNGENLYVNCEITKQQRGTIQSEGWWDPNTICVRSMVIYPTRFENKKIRKIVRRGVVKATSKY